MCGNVIKDLIGCGIGYIGVRRFLAAKGAEANKELVFGCVHIVEEVSDDSLDVFDTSIM